MAGQPERESGALARFALHLDLSAVGLGQFLADSQPQPDALGFGGEQRLEKFFHVFRSDAATGVFDSDQYTVFSIQ